MVERLVSLVCWTPQRLERLVFLLNRPASRGVGRALTRLALEHQRLLRGPQLQRALRKLLLEPSACCREGSNQLRLIQRYLNVLDNPGGMALVRRLLARAGDPAAAARQLEALVRIGLLGMLRHELLARAGSTRPPLVEVQLAPYPDCNLRCVGCYSEGDRDGAAPDREQLAYLVDQAAVCGAIAVHIVGKGEPLLTRQRAEDLLAVAAGRPHLLLTIATNGSYMRPDLARAFARLGNVLLLVSVEGPRAVHDARRGTGSHDQAADTMRMLRSAGALFGFAAMVHEQNHQQLTDPGFVARQAAAGCLLGVYSGYFPLSAQSWRGLALGPSSRRRYRRRLDRLAGGALPLLDLEQVEQHTGCRARAGVTVYIDGVTGQVAPCIRMPFSPPACRLDRGRGVGLAQVLEHPFFQRYRPGDGLQPGCGRRAADELGQLAELLQGFGVHSTRLEDYRQRCERGG